MFTISFTYDLDNAVALPVSVKFKALRRDTMETAWLAAAPEKLVVISGYGPVGYSMEVEPPVSDSLIWDVKAYIQNSLGVWVEQIVLLGEPLEPGTTGCFFDGHIIGIR